MLQTVFLTSLSAIAFEILLTRVFAISQWHHLSFMVISIALFGLAASGTFLSIFSIHGKERSKNTMFKDRLPLLNLLYVLSALLSFLFVKHLPLDYFKLPVQPFQLVYLLAAYVALALPFYFVGMITAIAYTRMPDQTGYVYGMNMCGSAFGAVVPLIFLNRFEEGRLLMVVAIIPLLTYFRFPRRLSRQDAGAPDTTTGGNHKLYATAGILLAAVVMVIVAQNPALLRVSPSDYKGLSQMLQMPETVVVETFTGIRGRIDRVKSPFLRYFPGLSLNYAGNLPSQFAVFKDGDSQLVCNEKAPDALRFSQHTLSYAGYAIRGTPGHVLILQNGGGTALPCALAAAPHRITVLENHPRFADILRRHYGIPVMSRTPRSFLAASSVMYDIIHLENWGTSLPGTSSLVQNHMFTRQAFQAYFDHLVDDGLLIISRRLILPPSNMLRLCGTLADVLTSMKIKNPRHHIIVLRNWDTFTLIASRRPLQHAVPAVKTFAASHSFDIVWPQAPEKFLMNHYNKFEKPFYYLSMKSMMDAHDTAAPHTFFKTYALDVSPQSDNRPFPDKFFKWSKAKTIHQMTGSRLYTLLLSGEIIVGVLFLEALLIAACLLMLPLWIFGRQEARLPMRRALYFLGIGAGFILFEIFFINTYILIYDDPALSFTVVLGGMLLFSSAGGLISEYLAPGRLKVILGLLCVLLVLMGACLDVLLERMLPMPISVCFFMSLLLMLPAGLLLGIPFPMGMRCLLAGPSHRAYAWAANGCASVLASIAATQMAISLGLKTLLGGAIICYFAAWWVVRKN